MTRQVMWIVAMGVAGCGKSTLAAAIAARTGLPFIEGDDFHSPQSVAKMLAGKPLSDADRADWLNRLGIELAWQADGAVVSCSALKHMYRERLRAAVPGLKFVFLEIERETAEQRVAARAGHMFPAGLLECQFATLESPRAEPGVLTVVATEPVDALCAQVLAWAGAANLAYERPAAAESAIADTVPAGSAHRRAPGATDDH
jgi:gluconokinase